MASQFVKRERLHVENGVRMGAQRVGRVCFVFFMVRRISDYRAQMYDEKMRRANVATFFSVDGEIFLLVSFHRVGAFFAAREFLAIARELLSVVWKLILIA